MTFTNKALAAALAAACLTTQARAFLDFPWNEDQYFGPDGPWQAVNIQFQYVENGQRYNFSVIPGFENPNAIAYLPTSDACAEFPDENCGAGGLINLPSNSSNQVLWSSFTDQASGWAWNYSGPYTSLYIQLPGNLYQRDVIVTAATSFYVTYPNGRRVATPVGQYSLGGSPSAPDLSTPLSVFNADYTESNSFGLHIGSTHFNYKGSLVFGGYNPGRAIGPLVEYTHGNTGSVNLLDITIGVETGGSPFSFNNQSNLLLSQSSATSAQALPAFVYPNLPYIYAPQATVDAITALLPVSLDNSGFYLWNTSDPLYTTIVTSPAYLGFVFSSNAGAGQTTIKIPFALLNLTLEKSVTGYNDDKPYFPIMTVLDTQLPQDSLWLGRAFLQGAYYAVNWGNNATWLAQAPGPGSDGEGLGSNPVNLDSAATTLNVQSGDELFSSSWSAHWTPLPENYNGNSTDNGGHHHSSGLSGGAIGGIVAGVVVGVGLVAGIAFFLTKRGRQNRSTPPAELNAQEKPQDASGAAVSAAAAPVVGEQSQTMKNDYDTRHWSATSPVPQYDGQQYPGYSDYYYNELPGHSAMPSELPGNHAQELPASVRQS